MRSEGRRRKSNTRSASRRRRNNTRGEKRSEEKPRRRGRLARNKESRDFRRKDRHTSIAIPTTKNWTYAKI